MRGSPRVCHLDICFVGIIPAHAGLTCRHPGSARGERDHPRACGAHVTMPPAANFGTGSSPRMRGSQDQYSIYRTNLGIIPAHAGLTESCSPSCSPSRDHPRACGAHYFRIGASPRGEGSSPRMRGSRERIRAPADYDGIIPAHAGLTASFFFLLRGSRDHPRACGAHQEYDTNYIATLGSSPRMRGSPCGFTLQCIGLGIIPAHAGLTSPTPYISFRAWDHPRACGAHLKV